MKKSSLPNSWSTRSTSASESGHVTGKINSRREFGSPYRLANLERGIVPGRGIALDFYWSLLSHKKLMFAKDARVVLDYL
jgi:hypothetical protein